MLNFRSQNHKFGSSIFIFMKKKYFQDIEITVVGLVFRYFAHTRWSINIFCNVCDNFPHSQFLFRKKKHKEYNDLSSTYK